MSGHASTNAQPDQHAVNPITHLGLALQNMLAKANDTHQVEVVDLVLNQKGETKLPKEGFSRPTSVTVSGESRSIHTKMAEDLADSFKHQNKPLSGLDASFNASLKFPGYQSTTNHPTVETLRSIIPMLGYKEDKSGYPNGATDANHFAWTLKQAYPNGPDIPVGDIQMDNRFQHSTEEQTSLSGMTDAAKFIVASSLIFNEKKES